MKSLAEQVHLVHSYQTTLVKSLIVFLSKQVNIIWIICLNACGNAVYVRRNAAFTLHLGHVTGDMKQHESNETLFRSAQSHLTMATKDGAQTQRHLMRIHSQKG